MAFEGISRPGVTLVIVTAVFFVLATVMISLRFVSRRQTRTVGADDWMSLISYIFMAGLAVCHTVMGAPYGYVGAPMWELSPQQIMQHLLMIYVDNIFYTLCTTTVKMSIVLLFRRIFATRIFKHITTVLLAILTMWGIAVLLVQIFSCIPVEASWIPAKAQTCVDTQMFYNAVTISNVIFDCMLLILPLPMVWKLHLGNKKKLQVTGVFLVGAFTCICSIMRTITLQQLDQTNVSGTIWKPGLWTFIECAVGVSCACMPPLAHLFKKWHTKAAGTYANHISTKQSYKLSAYDTNPESRASLTGTPQSGRYIDTSPRLPAPAAYSVSARGGHGYYPPRRI